MSQSAVPLLDMSPELDDLWDELMTAIQSVLRAGQFIMGPNVKALESELATYLGSKHAIAVNSGTDALVIGLRAVGVGPGDEVITTPFTFFASAEAVSMLGATPVFVDIEPDTLNMDVAKLEAAITPRTKAIIPVHIFGQSVDLAPVLALAERFGLKVVEDVAQAFGGDYQGKKLGTLGHLGAYSFFPSKNLGAYGDGGLIVTDDDAVAETCRMLRVHGAKKKYFNEVVGYNSRLDEIQAAILRVKLPHIDRWNQGRREVAERYRGMLAGLSDVQPQPEVAYGTHVYHQFTIRLPEGIDRDALQKYLSEAGVSTMVYYPVPVHRLPLYLDLGYVLPVAEQACRDVISLPIWPTLDVVTQGRVVDALTQALGLQRSAASAEA